MGYKEYIICREAKLISSVILDMFNYRASIFMLPNEVLEKITKTSRSYLWGGSANSRRIPHIFWQHIYFPGAQGGLGLKEFKL